MRVSAGGREMMLAAGFERRHVGELARPALLRPLASALPFLLHPPYRAAKSNAQYSESPSRLRRLERDHRSVSTSRSHLPTHRVRYLHLPIRHAERPVNATPSC